MIGKRKKKRNKGNIEQKWVKIYPKEEKQKK